MHGRKKKRQLGTWGRKKTMQAGEDDVTKGKEAGAGTRALVWAIGWRPGVGQVGMQE